MSEPQAVETWTDQTQWLRAMAHPVRLRILAALCEQPRCVKDINSMISILQPHLSQHIAALRNAGLIDCHIAGSLRCYYIVRPTLVKKMMRILSQDHPLRLRDRRSVMRAVQRRQAEVQAEAEAAATHSLPSAAGNSAAHKQRPTSREKGKT
jgi:ArsR family transcriptional regulator